MSENAPLGERTAESDPRPHDELSVKQTELGVGAEVLQTDVVKRREVKLTSKALTEKIDNLQKERKAKLNKLPKLKQAIAELIRDKEHVKEVKCAFEKYTVLCDEAKRVHVTLLGYLPTTEATKQEIWYQAKMLNVNDFIAVVSKWLTEVQWCPAAAHSGDINVEEKEEHVNGDDNDEQEVQVETAVNGGNGEEEVHVEPHDSISNIESRISSKRSSSKSTTSSACIKAEADKAALMARAAALREKHALEEQEHLLRKRMEEQKHAMEEQEHLLRRRKEQLELDTELAATTARLAVLQACGSSVASKQTDGMESYIRKGAKPKSKATFLNPHATEYESSQQHFSLPSRQGNVQSMVERPSTSDHDAARYSKQDDAAYQQNMQVFTGKSTLNPQSQTKPAVIQTSLPPQGQTQTSGNLYSLLQQQNDITSLLVQMQTSQFLPHREIPIYDGDPLQFKTFMKAFEHCVEAKTNSKGDCLYYLEQFTRGQPRDLVRSCLHMLPERGYSVAKHLLQEHFGNGLKVTAAYMERINRWPSVKSEDTRGLQAYGLFLRGCSNAMEELQYLEELNMPANMRILIQKLPYKLRDRWRAKACDILDRTKQRACFPDIVSFIEQQVRIASDPVFGDIQDTPLVKGGIKSKYQEKPQYKRNSFATHVSIENEFKAEARKNENVQSLVTSGNKANPTSCLYCVRGHALEQCPQLGKKTHREKLDFLKEKGLCFGCLRRGHLSRNCDRRITCRQCNQTHPSILHIGKQERISQKDTEQPKEPSISCTSTSTCGHTGAGHNNGILPILPVQLKCTKGNKVIETYAFLDPGSTGTFCSERLVNQLNTEGRRAKIHLRTMGHNKAVPSCIINGLEISGVSGKHFYELPDVFTQKEMPVSTDNIISKEELAKWPYLKDIRIPRINADVDLLIGTNASKLMEPWEVINSRGDGPYAVRTLLGWVINGPLQGNRDSGCGYPKVNVNRTTVDRIEELLVKQFNYDFNERTSTDQEEMSREEIKFVEIMKSSAQLQKGHYKFKLPFKKEEVTMPNNHYIAKQRASGLKKRFQKDLSFHDEYTNFLADVISNGYAEQVPLHQLEPQVGKVWYIPHHGVYHPRKGKLRVVFDCGAEFKGVSLNSQLLQGPNLTSSLIGILMRFRQERVAIMADIQAMFHQVKVAEKHVDFLRFLWWPEGNLENNLVEHRMTVHLFGAVSSPSCACFALRKTAEDNKASFPPEVIDTINRNFYMDDLLKSLPSEKDAVFMAKHLIAVCSRGGFNLTQWISNSREVLQSIPEELKSKHLYELDLDRDKLPMERALGLQWCIETDTFKFKLKVKEQPHTKRGMLSIISSVYDPLGFLAPFILPAKLLLQELCRTKCDWDDPIPPAFQQKWNKWLTDLEKVAGFKVDRCVKPKGFGRIADAQLHHFSDASENGYGTVTYVRMQNMKKMVHVAFLFGKARVAPLKPVTIPRLELTAAVVAVRVNKMLQSELQIPLKKSCFWTDSTSVLKYIKNEDKRFQTFVTNRVSTIRDNSDVAQWRYVPTSLNPADDASRGLKAEHMVKQRWIEGAKFLWEPEDRWPASPMEFSVTADDPEVKRNLTVNATVVDTFNATGQLITFFSDWQKLKVTVAWIIKLKVTLLKLSKKRKQLELANTSANGSPVLDVHKEMQAFGASLRRQKISLDDLSEAETSIIYFCQRERFLNEIATLTSSKPEVPRSSTIYKLDPILEGGLLRVGGRLTKAAMPEDVKHPLILSKDQHISNLILRYFHEQLGHGGRNHVLSTVRRKYWITSGNSAARKVIASCRICRRYRGKTGEQKMADLPEERVVPDLPPFTNVGVDYFGPIEVKRGRSIVKRYGVIFTCMASRAVHLEVACSLDTDSCINALRRFICRRGQVSHMRSDNGTNFVGAERELREALASLNQDHIEKALLQRGIKWSFNPPTGSHHGGAWERIIRMIRKILCSVLRQQTLTDEGLQTVLCEAEAMLNDRPITKLSEEPNDLEALTPNHLLLMKGKPILPPGLFDQRDLYARRRWKQVQYISNLFWKRWIHEYLPLLQERQKWTKEKRSFISGDIVMVVDSTAPRGSWVLGRIVKTFPDKKGLVRSVRLQTKTNMIERPVTKICLLCEATD